MFHLILGLFSIGLVWLSVMILLLFIAYYVWQVLKQILYCFSLYGLTKDKKAFIPFYNKYIFGKAGVNKIYGIILVIISTLKIFIDLWILDVILETDLLVYNLLPSLSVLFTITVFVLYYILYCVCASKVFEKECKKAAYIILTVLSYLSLGMLIPIFIFFTNKIKKKSVNHGE